MDGVINIYKPEGITSFDVVRTVRKLAHTKKVGHTGTLDPEACGVLPVCIGKGTKLVDYIMNGTKEYKAVLKLGITTDSYDRVGKVLKETPVLCSEDEITKAVMSFTGNIDQIPPMYSAIKVNGQKLYELARKGIEIERASRSITIYSIQIEQIKVPYVAFTVKCSKGTYIRSLCHDIGEKLNCGGAMWELERTQTGVFSKEKSVPLADLNEGNLQDNIISIQEALGEFPSINFDNKFKSMLLNGVKITDKNALSSLSENKIYRVYFEDCSFVGLGIKYDDGFKIIKLFYQEQKNDNIGR